MRQEGEVRIDKWLWAVRVFKTRSIASEACKKGHILMDGGPVKSSRNVKVGDVIQVRKVPVVYSFKVLALLEKRVGAKLVAEYMQDVTPEDQIEILELQKLNVRLNRQKGTGRPTKKERRDLENFFNDDDLEDMD